MVRRLLAARGGGESAYLATHSRLDRDTSGVVLFCRDPRANPALGEAFATRAVEKTYLALVLPGAGSEPPRRWTSRAPLALRGSGRSARMVADERGEAAETAFRVVERAGPALLVEACPRSGRKHQIRAHLAQSRLPVFGDVRYGGASRIGRIAAPRVMLHARRIALRHPLSGEPVAVEAPLAPDFAAALDALRMAR
jgi:23S rRNA-/tRNA-specific pseudouridylate synthase